MTWDPPTDFINRASHTDQRRAIREDPDLRGRAKRRQSARLAYTRHVPDESARPTRYEESRGAEVTVGQKLVEARGR